MRAVTGGKQGGLPRLRVTIVQQGGVLGGAERWQLQLADATERMQVSAVGLGDGPATAAWAARGWPVVTLPDERSKRGLLATTRRLLPVLRRTLPDVVVAHGVKAALVAVPAARVLGIPVVWVRHDGSFDGRLPRLLDRWTDAQVSTSAWLFEGRDPSNALVVNPPRMVAPIDRDAARAALGLTVAPGDLVLGMAARITRYKGIEDAIRALAMPGGAAWTLALAGIHEPSDPDELERLVKVAADLGVTERLVLLGEVPDFGRVVRAFDAVAVLSKPTPEVPWLREAFGMSALEAITGGVPVIATPPVETIAGRGGLAVGPDSPAEVAEALGILHDPAARTAPGAAGVVQAEGYPTAAEAADRLVDLLANLAHRPGIGHGAAGPAISVVTTVLDDQAALTDLLTALVPQLGPDDEIIVVDGGSTDGTAEVVLRGAEVDPRLRLLVEPGAGISAGRNIGIRQAVNDTIACTDAGCVPVPGWLGAFRVAHDRHPEVELWTGTYRVESEAVWEHALVAVGYPSIEELARPTPLAKAYGRLFGRSFDPTMPTGRSVSFSRRAWAAAGGYPEHLQTGEDVLFGRSVVDAGFDAAMVRDAEVSWAQRPTLRANLTMLRRYGEGSGNSMDRRLLGRDLARVAAYGVGAVVALRGGPVSRSVVAAGAASYLSLPIARALNGPSPLATAAMVPPITAARDLSKAWGAVSAALRRTRTSS
ncbi:glycosyltransferase [Nocardioides stalactiti]|uniref:glycosyltransferase n=1 Tax=Nocardioides stalactiti TaxID=2755356 RepID=UPI00160201B5|nr:glycosyltransferase [Nocardioides stalactiti]